MNENKPTSDEETSVPIEESTQPEASSGSVADNIKARSIWLRLFFMLVVTLLYSVSRVVVGAVVVVQFFWVLLTGETNQKLLSLGQSLATYTYQIVRYLTFNTQERPFPFDADWPELQTHTPESEEGDRG